MASKCQVVFWLFLLITFPLKAQQKIEPFQILFYNLENFFDCKDDSITADESYTPEGDLHWTYNRFEKKKLNISKAIIAAGGWSIPDIVVLCEIENRYVIDELINKSPLNKIPFKVIHKESPDHRGIDVAMIYNSERFYPLSYQYYPLEFKKDLVATRELLYVSGIAESKDTIHIFGNHWPSRYSGLMETKELRNAAAELLIGKVKKLNETYVNPKIVIVGDFNDTPFDDAIRKHLNAREITDTIKNEQLYDLSAFWIKPNQGTIKYQSQWYVFDQIIVSGSLLKNGKGLYTTAEEAIIINPPFLLENDDKFGGKKPFRTYNGFKYQGGFSDHLPVLLKLLNDH